MRQTIPKKVLLLKNKPHTAKKAFQVVWSIFAWNRKKNFFKVIKCLSQKMLRIKQKVIFFNKFKMGHILRKYFDLCKQIIFFQTSKMGHISTKTSRIHKMCHIQLNKLSFSCVLKLFGPKLKKTSLCCLKSDYHWKKAKNHTKKISSCFNGINLEEIVLKWWRVTFLVRQVKLDKYYR